MSNNRPKIINVHRRMKLHEAGFNVALRWDNYSNDIGKFESKLREQYGPEAWYAGAPGFWKMHWGKPSWTMHPGGYTKEYNRPYFIGFRNEADISVALLLL